MHDPTQILGKNNREDYAKILSDFYLDLFGIFLWRSRIPPGMKQVKFHAGFFVNNA
jgi:hypothetical protein